MKREPVNRQLGNRRVWKIRLPAETPPQQR